MSNNTDHTAKKNIKCPNTLRRSVLEGDTYSIHNIFRDSLLNEFYRLYTNPIHTKHRTNMVNKESYNGFIALAEIKRKERIELIYKYCPLLKDILDNILILYV